MLSRGKGTPVSRVVFQVFFFAATILAALSFSAPAMAHPLPPPSAAHAPARAQQAATHAGETYFVCTLPTSAAGVLTYYVSDVNGPFDFKSAGPALDKLAHAFSNFLTAKYHAAGGSVSCVYQYSQADAERLKQRDLTTGYSGYRHVDTGWKNAETATPGATAPSDSGTPYYCYSYYKFPGAARQTDYTTGVFSATASYGWTRLWWSAYVRQTYHIPVDAKSFEVDCNQLSAAPDKQQQVLSRNVTLWKERNEDVVQVSWKPTQTAPAGAAEPSVKEMLSGQVRLQDHAPIGASATNAGADPAPGQPLPQTGNGKQGMCWAVIGKNLYVSAMFDASKASPGEDGKWVVAFGNYVAAHIDPKPAQAVRCIAESAAAAQATLNTWKKSASSGGPIVKETGWVYRGPEPGPVSNKGVAPGQGSGTGQWVLCYSDVSQSPLYLSGDFQIDVPLARAGPEPDPSSVAANARAIGELKTTFLAYIQKQYGYHSSSSYPVYCQGGAGEGDLAGARDLLHSRFAQVKFVETGWKPGMLATADKSSEAKPATPPSSAAQTAYERAMAAQRPATSSASRVDAAGVPISGNSAATDTSGQKYSYCYTIGSLPHAPSEAARSNYYVSPVFAAGPASAPAPTFQKMLQAAHPQVQIQTATCSKPQSLAATQTSRNNEIAARKNNPYITTVEVNWKP